MENQEPLQQEDDEKEEEEEEFIVLDPEHVCTSFYLNYFDHCCLAALQKE